MLVQAIEEVRTKLGEDSITTDDDELHRHGYSEWSTINVDVLPIAVVYPKSTEEVSEIAKICYKRRIPIGKLIIAMPRIMLMFPGQCHTLEAQVWKATSLLRKSRYSLVLSVSSQVLRSVNFEHLLGHSCRPLTCRNARWVRD